jgi:hypothetical protein
MLGQQSKLERARARDFTAIRSFFAGHQTKDSRFAGAVSPHKTDVLARVNLERSAAQHILRAIGFIDI